MVKLTLCLDCPCLNSDNEDGDSCNLGYSTGYVKVTTSNLVTRNDPAYPITTSHTMSPDCELVKIVDGKNEILPEIVEVDPLEEPKFNRPFH